jgi:two-component system, NarL family, invasion response regulator UvrY
MLRILIADDHDIMREGIKELLCDEFPLIHIGEASNTDSLIMLACGDHWDIIISDIKMPGGGVFAALPKIKVAKPDVPFIVISSNSPEDYAERALKAGAIRFISKSVLVDELADAVKAILNKEK